MKMRYSVKRVFNRQGGGSSFRIIATLQIITYVKYARYTVLSLKGAVSTTKDRETPRLPAPNPNTNCPNIKMGIVVEQTKMKQPKTSIKFATMSARLYPNTSPDHPNNGEDIMRPKLNIATAYPWSICLPPREDIKNHNTGKKIPRAMSPQNVENAIIMRSTLRKR